MHINQLLVLATTTFCALLGPSTVQAAVVPQSSLTPADSVFMGGLAYNDSSSGQYVFTGAVYQGAPVYEHATNSTWKLYRRANGNWHVDFNDISEDWSGTIAYTTGPAQTPWDATWQGTGAATRTAAIYITSNTSTLTGTYTFEGATHDGQPVYEPEAGNVGFLHFRAGLNRWIFSPEIGTGGYYSISEVGCTDPARCDWTGKDAAVTSIVEVETQTHTGVLTGTYSFEGSRNDGKPVYDPGSGLQGFIHYRAGLDRWIFSPEIGTGGYYSISEPGCNEPGRCQSWSGKDAVMFEGAIIAETTVALKTAHNKYVVAEQAGGGDVNANRTAIGAWEKLDLIELSTGEVLLRAPNGQFICPDNGGGGDVHATSLFPTAQCYLSMFTTSDDSVVFLTQTGNYLCGESNGQFVANRTKIGSWEKFSLVNL